MALQGPPRCLIRKILGPRQITEIRERHASTLMTSRLGLLGHLLCFCGGLAVASSIN